MNTCTQVTYPSNLLLAIKGKSNIELPPKLNADVLAGIAYVLSLLSEQEQELLRRHYVTKQSMNDIAETLSIPEDVLLSLEKDSLLRLRHPGKWNYIQYGIAGYCKRRADSEYNKGFSKGYAEGYAHGKYDGQNNIAYSYGPDDLLTQPLEFLNLSTRAHQCMRFAGCKTVGDLTLLPEDRIMVIRNLGLKTAAEIAKKLESIGIKHSAWDIFL